MLRCGQALSELRQTPRVVAAGRWFTRSARWAGASLSPPSPPPACHPRLWHALPAACPGTHGTDRGRIRPWHEVGYNTLSAVLSARPRMWIAIAAGTTPRAPACASAGGLARGEREPCLDTRSLAGPATDAVHAYTGLYGHTIYISHKD